MPGKAASGRKSPPDVRGRTRGRAPSTLSDRAVAAARARGKIGLALAGGGPLGGIYEVGALLALTDSLDGIDSIGPRRLRRRVVGRLRRRGAGERHLAGADVSALHRRRGRRGADARSLPASRVRRIRAARLLRCRGSSTRATLQYLRDPFRHGLHGVVRDTFARGAYRACSTTARSATSCARLFAAPGRTNDFRKLDAQAVPGRDESRHRRSR